MRRGPEAALGRRDATRRGFTGRDGEGRTGTPPARPVKSGSADAPPPGAEGGALSCSSSASSSSSSSCSRSSRSAGSCRALPRRARPELGTARRLRAPRDGSDHGRLRRAGRGRGRALHTARARGPSSDLPLARAVSRPAAQWAHWAGAGRHEALRVASRRPRAPPGHRLRFADRSLRRALRPNRVRPTPPWSCGARAARSLKGLSTALAITPPHAPAVLASCAPRPGVVAGESRARPFFSGGVGVADAVSEALALRPRTPGRGPLRSSRPLRCSSTAPRAASRQRGRDHRGEERPRNEASRLFSPNSFCIGGLAGRRRLPRRPRRLTFSATSSATSRVSCTSPEHPVRPGPRPSRTGSSSLALRASWTACGPERGVPDIAEPLRSPRRRCRRGPRRRRRSSSCAYRRSRGLSTLPATRPRRGLSRSLVAPASRRPSARSCRDRERSRAPRGGGRTSRGR